MFPRVAVSVFDEFQHLPANVRPIVDGLLQNKDTLGQGRYASDVP